MTSRVLAPDGKIEREDPSRRVYFVARDGTRWRVYDRVYERMVGWHAHAPPCPGAEHRVFVPQRGVKRVFQFRGPQPPQLTSALLDTQLRGAEDMIVERSESGERNPW